jgi:hypothetical protein
LTHQSVHGRANDGGLRIGEMERDGILGHGMASFLNDSFLNRGDEYYIAVCNTTGTLAIYNESKNLFLSPQADGPVKFVNNVDGTYNIKNVSKFGRSFSILRVPYSFKLLLQELQAMNVNMRIITNDNIDNLMSMSYSDNINKILKSSTLNEASNVYKNHIHKMRTNRKQNDTNYWIGNQDAIIDNNEPSIEEGNQISSDDISDIQYASDSPAYNNDIQYASDSPAFNNDIQYASDSPAYNNDSFNINILPTTPPGSPPISQTNQKDTSEIVSLDESKNKSDKSDNSFMGFDITNIFGNDETNKKVSILDPEVDINSINDTDDKNDENDISSNVKQIKITNT